MSRGRKRVPTDAEEALWQQVAKTVKPLRTPPPKPEPADAPPPPAPQPPRARAKPAAPAVAAPAPPKPKPPPLSPIDRRTMSRLGRGIASIDSRIDLHGMTQARAHDRLVDFLRAAQASGARIVLVITGKGGEGRGDERGVLRRVVPVWLSSAELRPVVIGFDEAARSHGGSGALYVRLRRPR